MVRHESEWVEPVSTTYRAYNIWELPPNGQGIAALQILNILEGYDIRGIGSGMTPDSLGFILQDRGELFDLTPGRNNTCAARKRPFHTIIPAFITREDKPFMAFGVMGGSTQPQGHAQIVINMIDFGMNIQEAGDAPRMVHRGSSQPTGYRMSDGGKI
jgi:gamma-glutamyltranspeptidase/glutathione hydrolase